MKLLRIIFTFLLCLSTQVINAYDFMFNGLCYSINDDDTTVTLTYYNTPSNTATYPNLNGTLNIPEIVSYNNKSYTVVSIGEWAFLNCQGITSIIIPNTVSEIGDYAFGYCPNLSEILIPESVISIGSSSFENTTWYNNQPDGLVYAGMVAYRYKGTMPEGTSITLKDGCTGIAMSAFRNCSNLLSITIPNSVVLIGNSAFWGCSNLNSINIPESIISIGLYAFSGCNGLTIVSISDIAAWCNIHFEGFTSNPIEYAHNLYLNGDKLTNLIIPSNVTTINDFTFTGCSGLTSIVFPNDLKIIGEGAFRKCTGLISVSFGNSITTIGKDAFYSCSGLTSVNITDLAAWCNIDFNSNPLSYAHNLYLNGSKVTNLSIPNSVTTIKPYTFYDCSSLTSVTIPNSVTSIGDCAFEFCSGLTSVIIGNSVTTIGSYAFRSCSGLTNIYSLIEDPSFVTLGSGVFSNVNTLNCTLTVPAVSLNLYKNANQWKDFLNIQPDITVTSITLNHTILTMDIGEIDTLTAIVYPTNAISEVIWSSSKPSVATINNYGVITAIAPGISIVTATTTDGTNLSASCEVTVIPQYDIYPTTTELMHVRGQSNTSVVIPFWMSNKTAISGLQFDITLPTGVSFATVDDYPDVWLEPTRKARNHSVDVNLISGSKYRVLVSSPTNNTFKGNEGVVLYLRLNIEQAHPIGSYYINTSNVIMVEPDETQHTGYNKSILVKCQYLLGDADGDATVDVADYTVTALYILSRPVETFYSDAANVSGDNSINVTDLVGITNISLGIRPHEYRPALEISMNDEVVESAPMLKASVDAENIVTLSLDNDMPLAGLQFDLQLPQGMTLAGATVEGRAANYQIGTNTLADGSVRLLISSFGDKDIVAGNDAIIKLVLEGTNANNDVLYITGAQAATRDLRSYEIDDVSLPIGTTSINDVGYSYDRLNIYGKGNTIIVDSPESMIIQVVHINGMVMPIEIKPGHNTIDVGDHGVYIIRVGSSVYKVRI